MIARYGCGGCPENPGGRAANGGVGLGVSPADAQDIAAYLYTLD